jgi:hypothetical protein
MVTSQHISRATFAAMFIIGLGSVAGASTVQFSFDAMLQTGPLVGTEFPGTGTYDTTGVTGIGQEFVSLASLDFTLGVPFTRSDIRQGGQAILQNGVLSYFTAAFFPPPPSGSPVSDIAFGFGGPGIIGYITPPSNFGSGTYTITSLSVPEPGAALILAVALLSLDAIRRRSPRKRSGDIAQH